MNGIWGGLTGAIPQKVCILTGTDMGNRENRGNMSKNGIDKNIPKKSVDFSLSLWYILSCVRQEHLHRTVRYLSGCGSAWLERLVWDQEVAGSNPVTPMFQQVQVVPVRV